ncbi:MAG: hypothetical protein JKY25_05840, partial [Robiginitomaculum sp.]|nr:hypothetical protein [Robiginitomaculum sp.]
MLHVGAALKHGFINKDGVLRSMSSSRAGLGIGAIFAALGLGIGVYFLAPAPTAAPFVFTPVIVQTESDVMKAGEIGEAEEVTQTPAAVEVGETVEAEEVGEAGENRVEPAPVEQAV